MPIPDRAYRIAAAFAWRLTPLAGLGGDKLAHGVRARRDAADRLIAWSRASRDPARPLVWVHAPSVGEGLQARAVIEALREARPDAQLVFTHFSPSAEGLAARLPVDVAGPLPWDVRSQVGRAVVELRPSVVVFTKTELWPVLAATARACGARTALVAATLPAGSSRLGLLTRSVLRPTLAALDLVATVGAADARRYAELGVPPRAIHVVGDPGVDSAAARVGAADLTSPHLGPLARSPAPTVVAGSTWPSDEDVLLPALTALRHGRVPALRLVVAPHEPTPAAVAALERRLRAAGWTTARLAEVAARGALVGANAIVVDRVGVLAQLYTIGQVAWVGGGFHDAGLHSVIEPAAAGLPMVFGPRDEKSPAATELIAAGVARVVESADDAADALAAWLKDGPARASVGASARRYIDDRLGASARTAELVAQLLPPRADG